MPKPLSWPLVGNEHIKEFFIRHLTKGSLGGTYIFTGPKDVGKATIARYLAQVLLCENNNAQLNPCGQCRSCLSFSAVYSEKTNLDKQAQVLSSALLPSLASAHSDYVVIEREGGKKNISIQQVRYFIQRLNYTSFLDLYKIGIIKDAHYLSLEAANALLKTLEEPKKKTIIILTVDVLEQLPKTIISRAQILRFLPVPTDVIYKYLLANYQLTRPQARYLASQAVGRPAWAKKFAQNKKFFNYYQRIVELFFAFLPLDFTQRRQLFSREISSSQPTKSDQISFSFVLTVWQLIVRDLLLAALGEVDLIQHQIARRQLAKLADNFSIQTLLGWLEAIETAKKYQQANVSKNLSFEYLALSF